MNYTTAVFLINDRVRAVTCQYEAGDKAPKTMFKTLDRTIMPGDLVLVPTTTRHLMTVVRVAETDVEVDFDSPVEVQWIAGKVDQTAYQAILSQEAEAIAKIKSAQRNKKRHEIAAAMLADTEELKSLGIYQSDVETPAK